MATRSKNQIIFSFGMLFLIAFIGVVGISFNSYRKAKLEKEIRNTYKTELYNNAEYTLGIEINKLKDLIKPETFTELENINKEDKMAFKCTNYIIKDVENVFRVRNPETKTYEQTIELPSYKNILRDIVKDIDNKYAFEYGTFCELETGETLFVYSTEPVAVKEGNNTYASLYDKDLELVKKMNIKTQLTSITFACDLSPLVIDKEYNSYFNCGSADNNISSIELLRTNLLMGDSERLSQCEIAEEYKTCE